MNIRNLAVFGAFVLTTLSCGAWAGTDGTYVLEGGSYSIDVKFAPGTLTVIEPNKHSLYHEGEKPNEYLFTNPTNNVRYGMRVIDDATLEAFKPVPGNVPTRLKLRRAPTAAELPSDDVANTADAIAEYYFELSTSDPVNAQTWTQCAAAAMTRSTLPKQQADETAVQAATLLKMISGNRSGSPCPDAISDAAWLAAPTL